MKAQTTSSIAGSPVPRQYSSLRTTRMYSPARHSAKRKGPVPIVALPRL
jgi:hypothetical protein